MSPHRKPRRLTPLRGAAGKGLPRNAQLFPYEDEYEVTASFDDMQQKPPAAYSVKYDRAKGSWVIARAGQQRPVRRVATKEEALKIARELAKKTGAGLYVHKKDGKFQKV